MQQFMNKDFLLETFTARTLYHEYAAKLPICDFHCHIEAGVLAANQPFRDLTDAWLGGDHYKWRAMRLFGVEENSITGSADPEEKFLAWAKVLPNLIGNPLYHWAHLELQRYFAVEEPLNPASAQRIWQKVNDLLQKPAYRPIELLKQMNVQILCTTDDPTDSLADHQQLKEDLVDLAVIPASRPDRFTRLLNPAYPAIVKELPGGDKISNLADLAAALKDRADFFHQQGCRLSDHALDSMPSRPASRAAADELFQKRLAGETLTAAEAAQVQFIILTDLAAIYNELGWTMQLHIGALRNTSRRYFDLLGPDTGFDAIADEPIASRLVDLLDACQQNDQLPRTLLYSLDAADNMTLNTIASTFAKDGQPAWVSQGPAWWYHDHLEGMELHLEQFAHVGVLSTFIGMTTDSRSLLSYTRHEYFRRIICNRLGRWVESGQYPTDWPALIAITEKICWQNAADLFK